MWVVSDARGKISPFRRDKLYLSVYDSLRHRKTAISDSEGLTATIIARLARLPSKGQLDRKDLIDTTLTSLKRFDKAAAVHYQAYYVNRT